MESPSPTDRRQAWVRTSRHWLTLEDTIPQETQELPTLSDALPDDDVFLEGCSAGKIESWLQGCGPDLGPEDPGHMSIESLLKAGSSFEDDLSLGAEATILNIEENGSDMGSCPLLLPPPRYRQKGLATSTPQQRLTLPFANLGHSMASSGFSSSTSKTASSVSEVLQLCAEDAEETLYQLGFGCDEPQVTARIPARFFSFPSQLRGINFRLFLESQLQRLKQEDPGLSLASRFRQVEVLTAMANAFYSLYSYVSKTPLQKLAPPEFTFSASPVEAKIGPRFFSSVRSEPRSPVERFKDTVSKMCLYTGSSSRGSDSASPHASPRKRSSLPELVNFVIGSNKTEAIQEGDAEDRSQKMAEDARVGTDAQGQRECGIEGDGKTGGEEDGARERDGEGHREGDSELALDGIQCQSASLADQKVVTGTAVQQCGSSLVGSQPCQISSPSSDLGCPAEPERFTHLALHTVKPGGSFSPVPKFTQDIICPQIVERVHQAPFNCPQGKETLLPPIVVPVQGERGHDRTTPPGCQGGDHKGSAKACVALDIIAEESKSEEDESCLGHLHPDGIRPLASTPAFYPICTGQESPCRITVTGWEGDTTTSYTDTPKKCQATPNPDSEGNQHYLSPVRPPALGQAPQSNQQANSFELEEVHSAGEDDMGQSEGRSAVASSLLSAVKRRGGLPLRGDSVQSDSSGYAEEDFNPSSSSPEGEGS
ncbi:uncharacterized protein tespa1 isoform X1 [Megalops cyprinoides]|uniref:uncharacterized protein tespa1 isoform X1 n=1 Tax=Megalops cyprinoides TaxID=118141 RepID=UPI0018654A04|nr:uncharacterized protein tespa1 isoform X1 [Megalops cyprinoides]XP_036386692.1 uncharacterized protein tespa1 isoform X1 [Megalops cyprinoides]